MTASGASNTSDHHRPELESLMKRLDDQLQLGIRHRNSYSAAAVLTLYWEAADKGYQKEATDVVNFFQGRLNYEVEIFPIPSEKSQKALSDRISKFIDHHDEVERLLVVHYGGHGDENADRDKDEERRSVWAACSKGGPTVNWYDIQPQFNYADADVLLLLDCCHGSQSARDKIGFELLAGCAMKRQTLPPGPYSFTTILLREMEKLLMRNNEVAIAELYHHLIRSRAGLSETPIYVPSIGEGAREAICLSPIGHEKDAGEIDDINQDLYSLWVKIQVSGPLNDDVEMLKTLTNYLRRGLPQIIVGMNVEEIIARAEGLYRIARQGDRMMDGKPLIQAMNNTSRLRIGKLWRSTHRLLLECSSFWIAGCLNKAQLGASSLRDKLFGLLQKIDARNNTLAEVIAQGTTQIQELDESILNHLEHSEIAESAGLTESFRLQRLVRYSDNSGPSLEIDADSVRPLDKNSVTWQLDTDKELVIVERKSYEKHDHPQKLKGPKSVSEILRSCLQWRILTHIVLWLAFIGSMMITITTSGLFFVFRLHTDQTHGHCMNF
ncbi:hypothetical protein ABVK25_005374 [Lepraria finkii]|uniref:Peptidase C14 caspase domain-containing protein n=1 Tax=Lepraria finkii TaxID=1340010 RepID=A0ABR4BEA4_9LECA